MWSMRAFIQERYRSGRSQRRAYARRSGALSDDWPCQIRNLSRLCGIFNGVHQATRVAAIREELRLCEPA